MAIILYKEKKSTLTIEEIDGNFSDLNERLNALENSQNISESIDKIWIENNCLYIRSSRGRVFDPLSLAFLQWRACGPWETKRLYSIKDLVYYQNALYLCKEDTQDEQFHPKYWTCLFLIEAKNNPLIEDDLDKKDPKKEQKIL